MQEPAATVHFFYQTLPTPDNSDQHHQWRRQGNTTTSTFHSLPAVLGSASQPDDVYLHTSQYLQLLSKGKGNVHSTSKMLRHGSQFYLQITPCLPSPCKRSPDGATTDLWQHSSNCSLQLIYRPPKDERLSWPSWLTYSRRFTHTSGHPSAAGRAQDRKSLPVKDRRSTTVSYNSIG